MDYSNFEVEDFVADEYFIQWVKAPAAERNAFWEAWLSKNEDKKSIVLEAREIILLMDIKEINAPEGRFLEIWGKIVQEDDFKTILLSPEIKKETFSSNRFSIAAWLRVASVAASVLFATTLFYYLNSNKFITIKTAYGESRTLFLPDSTKVTLNANTTLRYSPENFIAKQREVWLDGEAFFSVIHKISNENFLVHTSELQVEVLGTRFNVNSRRGKSKVVLEEGKVKLDLYQNGKSSSLIMLPGEFAEFKSGDKELITKKVDPDDCVLWKNRQLIFIGTSISDIAQLIEDNYGFVVVIQDDELKTRKFTGSASSEDVHDLLQKLTLLFDLDVKQDGKQIIIKNQ